MVSFFLERPDTISGVSSSCKPLWVVFLQTSAFNWRQIVSKLYCWASDLQICGVLTQNARFLSRYSGLDDQNLLFATMPKRLTVADICTVTGYTRDELHATLKVLKPYCEERSAPRIAREFTARDLVVFCVTQVLEHRLGMRRAALVGLGAPLRSALTGPKTASKRARLVICVAPPSVEYVDLSITEKEGIVIALGPIFQRVDGYLSYDSQPQLSLTPELSVTRSRAGT